MKTNRISLMALSSLLSAHLLASPIQSHEDLNPESLDAAELIINLAPGIAKDLQPPGLGAERTVTSAIVTDSGTSRIYTIEGEDVNHDGHVLSTYWLRLIRKRSASGLMVYSHDFGIATCAVPMDGRTLSPEAQWLIGPMLNSVYDLAQFNLEHRRVRLDRIIKINADPLSFDIIGINQICEHTALNTFKINVTRNTERGHVSYETEITHPYEEPVEILPDLPEGPRCGKYWPC